MKNHFDKIRRVLAPIFTRWFAKWSLEKARSAIVESAEFGETEELRFLDEFVPTIKAIAQKSYRPFVFFDLGANVGIYTNMFNAAGFSVLAVEANRVLAKKLSFAYRGKGVAVLGRAVGATTKTVTFYESKNHGTSSIFAKNAGITRNEYQVASIELDDMIYLAPLFMKIDVEGAELAVLKSATMILEYVSPILLCETTKANYPELSMLLDKYGYVQIASFGYRTRYSSGGFDWPADVAGSANFLFLPSWAASNPDLQRHFSAAGI